MSWKIPRHRFKYGAYDSYCIFESMTDASGYNKTQDQMKKEVYAYLMGVTSWDKE